MQPITTALTLTTAAALLAGCMTNVGNDSRNPRDPKDDGDTTNCKKVTTPVTIRSAADFDGLPKTCWDLYAKLTIQGTSVTSLAKLGTVIGVNELELNGTNLTALDFAKQVTVYGPVTVTNNAKLTKLDNIEVIRADDVPLDITIDGNTVLTSIDGVGAVTRMDGDLTITNNPALTAAKLDRLVRIDGAVHVTGNTALASLDLTKLTNVTKVEIFDNAALTTVSGFSATTIAGDVVVRNNPKLTMLGTMSSLSNIQGSLTIDSNAALTNIGAFTTSMQYVTGAVTISNNGALTDLGQVSHFLGIGSLVITNNTNLSFCRAREVAACVNTQGSITITNNKSANNCTSWCGK